MQQAPRSCSVPSSWARAVRGTTAPNPWVGAVLVAASGQTFDGATEPPPGRHAEIVALDAARRTGTDPAGATLYTTLEPCSHTGRTAPCIDAVIAAGISRVAVGVTDPDPNVAGSGIEALRAAGIDVEVGVAADAVDDFRCARTCTSARAGRPWVVLKLAATLDGRIGSARRHLAMDHLTRGAGRRSRATRTLRCRAGGRRHRPGRRPIAHRS